MSISIEQLASELRPLAVSDFSPLPPPPKPAPAKPAAAPATPPAPPAPPPSPVQITDFAATGVHLDACLRPDQVVAAAQLMDKHGFAIDAVTGQDWLAQGLMEVIYDFLHFSTGQRVALRTRLPRANPTLATITPVFPGANWHERETHEMYGIVFEGHPNLENFLLPEGSDFHPLRKDYNP